MPRKPVHPSTLPPESRLRRSQLSLPPTDLLDAGTLPLTSAAAATRKSPRHARNEDRYRILDGGHPYVAAARRGALFVICDGVSTVPRGREAAELTVSRIDSFFQRRPHVDSLRELVIEIDWELRAGGKGSAACTLSLLWLANGRATVVHIGDSQVYRVRHGEAMRITQAHRGGRGLGAYMGMGPEIGKVMQVWSDELFAGDLFLMVTDGVIEVVPVEELRETWWALGSSPALAAQAIINEVDNRHGTDDATALVVDVLDVEAELSEGDPEPVRAG